MIGPHKAFAHLLLAAPNRDGRIVPVGPEHKVPSREDLDRHADMIGRDLGIVFQPEQPVGHYLVVPREGKSNLQLARQPYYAYARPDELYDAVRAVIARIHEDFGPGRVWTLGGRVHPITDIDHGVCGELIDGVLHLRVRSLICHENGPRAPGSEP